MIGSYTGSWLELLYFWYFSFGYFVAWANSRTWDRSSLVCLLPQRVCRVVWWRETSLFWLLSRRKRGIWYRMSGARQNHVSSSWSGLWGALTLSRQGCVLGIGAPTLSAYPGYHSESSLSSGKTVPPIPLSKWETIFSSYHHSGYSAFLWMLTSAHLSWDTLCYTRRSDSIWFSPEIFPICGWMGKKMRRWYAGTAPGRAQSWGSCCHRISDTPPPGSRAWLPFASFFCPKIQSHSTGTSNPLWSRARRITIPFPFPAGRVGTFAKNTASRSPAVWLWREKELGKPKYTRRNLGKVCTVSGFFGGGEHTGILTQHEKHAWMIRSSLSLINYSRGKNLWEELNMRTCGRSQNSIHNCTLYLPAHHQALPMKQYSCDSTCESIHSIASHGLLNIYLKFLMESLSCTKRNIFLKIENESVLFLKFPNRIQNLNSSISFESSFHGS